MAKGRRKVYTEAEIAEHRRSALAREHAYYHAVYGGGVGGRGRLLADGGDPQEPTTHTNRALYNLGEGCRWRGHSKPLG